VKYLKAKYLKQNLRYAILLGLGVLWIVPVLWMVDTALKPSSEIFSTPPKWIPSRFTMDHIYKLFLRWPYLRWLYRSLIVSSTAMVGALVLSTLAAFSFARLHWKGRDTLFLVLLVFMLLPWQINVIPLFFTMSKLKFLNTVQGVVLPIVAMPIGVFLLRQFFINIPRDLEDAARIDGCSRFGVLLRVILPVSTPVIAALGVFMFNTSWNNFFWSYICLQKSEVLTLPVGLRYLQGTEEIDYGLVMAAAFIAALPTFLFFVALRRITIRGFTLASTGAKG
jgi:ABC-type glycerol-3-phosphate transport system permease component